MHKASRTGSTLKQGQLRLLQGFFPWHRMSRVTFLEEAALPNAASPKQQRNLPRNEVIKRESLTHNERWIDK